ncbi:uncharacterized protein LOC143248711 isoform X1 [Tachypleus tridentatus]|uniref:uncharacterized protein LOC143248711 isoform X1 n=2 Tax=Tachypleus tridentatus TaxID=6853 RepID=UPI003FD17E2D
MARNEEKHFARLNRLLLERENEERKRRNPKRPRLEHLHTVDEIKMWLPYIKRDIDICLKQSQVICYPESRVHQYQDKVVKLEREYKAFVRKIKQLDPGLTTTPWTVRGYQGKAECEETGRKCEEDIQIANKEFVPIKTPLLDTLPSSEPEPPLSCVNPYFLDKPLEFSKTQSYSKKYIGHSNKPVEFSYLSENHKRDKDYIDKPTEFSPLPENPGKDNPTKFNPSSKNPRRDKDYIEKTIEFNSSLENPRREKLTEFSPSSEIPRRDKDYMDKLTDFSPSLENPRIYKDYVNKPTKFSLSPENLRRDKNCIEKQLEFSPSSEEYRRDENCVDKQIALKPATVAYINGKSKNILGLSYSSSEDDDA